MKKNRRIQSFALLILAAVLLAVIAVLGSFWQEAAIRTDFTRKNLAPCIQYPFGTDWMGRDMFVRTVAGLSLSIRIGLKLRRVCGTFLKKLSSCLKLIIHFLTCQEFYAVMVVIAKLFQELLVGQVLTAKS